MIIGHWVYSFAKIINCGVESFKTEDPGEAHHAGTRGYGTRSVETKRFDPIISRCLLSFSLIKWVTSPFIRYPIRTRIQHHESSIKRRVNVFGLWSSVAGLTWLAPLSLTFTLVFPQIHLFLAGTNDTFKSMKIISWGKITLIFLIALTGYITYHFFNTHFAKITIDYLAFSAGIFLITEGLYKMSGSKGPLFPDQLLRGFRVMIGIWIFTIHLFQFIKYRILSTHIMTITIDYKDYFAFSFGIFLVVEGLYKIHRSKTFFFPDRSLRIFRIIIGISLITIHILQFMHIRVS